MSVLKSHFFEMIYIRMVEEEIARRYSDQEMRCPVHLSTGQEAPAVGVAAALNSKDMIFTSHRSHAHYLAKGGSLKKMLAEIYGKATGCIGGRGGSMHLMDIEAGIHSSIPIIGSGLPLALGQAYVDKMDNNDRLSVAFFGDAGLEEGIFHECANFAVLKSLPLCFVCENNLYSVYTGLDERQPNRPLKDVAVAHGMNSFYADGNCIEAVLKATADCFDYMRAGHGPALLVFDTYRWREHCGPQDDDHLGYRPEGELEKWKTKDPIAKLRTTLLSSGALTQDEENTRTEAIIEQINTAFDFAIQSPLPSPEDAKDKVYSFDSASLTDIIQDQNKKTKLSFAEALRDGIHESFTRDGSTFLMGEGVADPLSMWGTTKGVKEKFGADRVVEMPISESAMVGMAIGAAMAGKRPVMSLQRVEFALLALEQIINNAAKAHYVSNGHFKVPFLLRLIAGRGWGQGAQHAQSLEAMFAHIPGLKVIMPALPSDAKGMITAAIEDNDPVICIESRWTHNVQDDIPDGYYRTSLEGPRVVHEGIQATIVASAYMTLEAIRAAKLMKEHDISVEVIDLRVVRPLVMEPILKSVKKTGHLLTVDTGWTSFGVGAEIVSQTVETCFSDLKSAPMRMGLPDYPTPSSRGMIKGYYPEAATIIEEISKKLDVDASITNIMIEKLQAENNQLPVDVPNSSFKGPF